MGLFNLFKGKDDKKDFDGKIFAPLSGRILPVEEVPDAVFAEKMVGDGVAIEPSGGDLILAPIDGKVEKIFDTNHAFSIVTESGIELFVHFGIDTVQLEGKGFERLIEEGKTVKRGTPIIKYDYEFLKANGVLLELFLELSGEWVDDKKVFTQMWDLNNNALKDLDVIIDDEE